MTILVTGASGFIGSAFIRRLFGQAKDFVAPPQKVVGLVRHTQNRNLARLNTPAIQRATHSGQFETVYGDLLEDISGLCEGIDAVVNFAAKTFVDHSIRDPEPFVMANIVGTCRLLEEARRSKVKRFIQIGTDEVYGAILEGAYTEDARLNPSNPYAAAKAGADCLALSYGNTYGMHVTVTRTENNYGPYQHRQKVLPTFVKKTLANEPLPVYGDGQHVRQWLWVDDHVDAVWTLLNSDHPSGEIYHVAGAQELTNLDLAKTILRRLGRPESQLMFIDDQNIRPGHDRRYALSCDKLQALGWKPKVGLEEGLSRAVKWYAENRWWTA